MVLPCHFYEFVQPKSYSYLPRSRKPNCQGQRLYAMCQPFSQLIYFGCNHCAHFITSEHRTSPYLKLAPIERAPRIPLFQQTPIFSWISRLIQRSILHRNKLPSKCYVLFQTNIKYSICINHKTYPQNQVFESR